MSRYTDAERAGDPMRWPVERNPLTGAARIEHPKAGWLVYSESRIAALLLSVITAPRVDEEKLAIARRLAGEERFAEFVEIHAALARAAG